MIGRSLAHRRLCRAVALLLVAALLLPALPSDARAHTSLSSLPLGGRGERGPGVRGEGLLLSRVQSTCVPGGTISATLVVTFTVTNPHPPAALPQLPPSATVTETLAAFAAWDPSRDPNAVHDLLLADTLTPHAVLVSSSRPADRAAPHYAWNLGDIPPLGRITLTLTLRVPLSVTERLPLDAGATTWGTYQDRAVSASAAPAVLLPDDFGEWLIRTVDADYRDEYVQRKAAELGGEPVPMFLYVRGLGYESYRGSLRGARGTLWSQAGNSLDKASLLVALLRGSGIPARYAHGPLSEDRARELILSMFPASTRTIGHLPVGTEEADPGSDPQLLAEARDHWWVQYWDGQWIDLDPSFAQARPGQVFAESILETPAEVPDALRHKVTVKVQVERYEQLTSIYGNLPVSYPLVHTFSSVELVGKPLSLGHLVHTSGAAGLFYTVRHTYTPYLLLADGRGIQGEPFQELLSNYPFGAYPLTGEWLIFEVRDPEGKVSAYRREVVDRIGFERRQRGGMVSVGAEAGPTPAVSELDDYTILVSPSFVPADALGESLSVLLSLAPRAVQAQALAGEVQGLPVARQQAALRELRNAGREVTRATNRSLAFAFAALSDRGAADLASGSLVRVYADFPRIAIVSSVVVSPTVRQTIDLLSDPLRAVVGPGQAVEAATAFRVTRGVHEAVLESLVLEKALGARPLSVATVMEEAAAQGIDLVYVDGADDLARAGISGQAKARILAAVQAGYVVLVPGRMVEVEGRPAIAWWQIDPRTGETVGVGEDGTHQAFFEYRTLFRWMVVGVGMEVLLPWLSGVHGTLWTVIRFHQELLLLMLKQGLNREVLQEAYNRTKAFMLALADEVERLCPFLRPPGPPPSFPSPR